ncbi:MAG: hypothetical protein H0U74_19445 [Bradymonadaceae bacterium]|nr:hypothetical protein [Lujinxingiaceae bacterium]
MNHKRLVDLTNQFIDALREDQQTLSDRGEQRPHAPPAQTPAPGQLWHVAQRGASLPALFYVAACELLATHCDGYLVHDHPWLAATDDLVLDAFESPTGAALVVCIWRPMSVHTDELVEYIDTLSSTVADALTALTAQSHSPRPKAIGHDMIDDAPVIEWEAELADGMELRYLTGARILIDDDPRKLARQALLDATLAHPTARAAKTADALPSGLHELFTRFCEAAAQWIQPALPDFELRCAFPVLDFGADPMMRQNDVDAAMLLHEFTIACGTVTATLCLSCGPTGMMLDGYAQTETGDEFEHLDVRWSQKSHDGFELVWAGQTDAQGLLQSPALQPDYDATQRIEIFANDVSTTFDF